MAECSRVTRSDDKQGIALHLIQAVILSLFCRCIMRKATLYHYQIPLKTSVVLRHQAIAQRQGILLCLEEKGNIGWGEIAPLPHFSQENLNIAELALRHWIKQWRNEQNPTIENLPPSVAFGISCALAELSGTLATQGNYQTVLFAKGIQQNLPNNYIHRKSLLLS